MSKIEALHADALSETPASPGISRHLAFKAENYRVLRSRSDPGTVSGWHHHGDYDVYGYVASGSARLEGKDGDNNVISLKQGDFLMFHLTPSTGRLILHQKKETSLFCFSVGMVP